MGKLISLKVDSFVVRDGAPCPVPFSARTLSSPTLCSSCVYAVTVCMRSYGHQSYCVQRTLFPWSLLLPLALTLFLFFSLIDP